MLHRHFIYLNGGKPNNEDDNAVFGFPTIQASNDCKMTFWYHMLGRQIGELNIYTRTEVITCMHVALHVLIKGAFVF